MTFTHLPSPPPSQTSTPQPPSSSPSPSSSTNHPIASHKTTRSQCAANLNLALTSPRIFLLLSQLSKHNPPSTIKHDLPLHTAHLYSDVTVECRPCKQTGPESFARGFVQAPPLSVVLCSNRLASASEIEETLMHELIHLYDLSAKKMDFKVCESLAHSEVRAAREAECQEGKYGGVFRSYCKNLSVPAPVPNSGILPVAVSSTETGGGGVGGGLLLSVKSKMKSNTVNMCDMWRKACTKERATRATSTMYGEKEGVRCVNEAFEAAFKDREPFR